MSDKTTTLAEIIGEATEDGTWINAPFECVVRNATGKNGKAPSKATLHDPANPNVKVKAAYFGKSFLDLNGSIVRFAGKGMKAKLYNGEVEITLSDKCSATPQGDAPAQSAAESAPPAGSSAPAQRHAAPPPPPTGDTTAQFHKGMKKIALLYMHSFQYATDVNLKLHGKLTPEQFQACVSTIFIAADRKGAVDSVPALREADGVGFKTYVPVKPTVDQAAIEADAKRAAEAAAAEAAAKAAEAARKKAQEHLDEDVPF